MPTPKGGGARRGGLPTLASRPGRGGRPIWRPRGCTMTLGDLAHIRHALDDRGATPLPLDP